MRTLPRTSAAWLACACVLALAAPSRAQDAPAPPPPDAPEQHEPDPPREQIERIFAERNRSAIHPGDPLHIVGREQEDNDLRSRTPALLRAERHELATDQDELYRRTLAAYEDGEQFHAPPHGGESAEALAPVRRGRAASRALEEPEASPWPTVLGLSAAALGLVWLIARPRA